MQFVSTQRRVMAGAIQTFFRIRLLKISQAYSWVKSSRFPMIEGIWLFIKCCAQLCHWYHWYFPAILSHLSAIETLTGLNYKKCRHDIELALGLINLDLCLWEDKLLVSSDDSSFGIKANLRNGKIKIQWVLITKTLLLIPSVVVCQAVG